MTTGLACAPSKTSSTCPGLQGRGLAAAQQAGGPLISRWKELPGTLTRCPALDSDAI